MCAETAYAGRVMALDLGEKRIGIALSDAMRLVGSAHSVMERRSRAEDFARIIQFIEENEVALLLIGLPITLAGHEGDRAAWVRDYGAALSQHLEIPLDYWDESLTTLQAEATLRAAGKRRKQVKAQVDAVAAALILQSYLDAQRSSDGGLSTH